MNDLEATKICAMALGLVPVDESKDFEVSKEITVEQGLGGPRYKYAPLIDGASALELVEVFGLNLERFAILGSGEKPRWGWRASGGYKEYADDSLKRAIVFCTAMIQK